MATQPIPVPQSQDTGEDMQSGELCIPLASLSQPDDKEQMQTPAEGDSITMQVDATVTRVDGENAYIKPTAVNGNPLEDGEGSPDEEGQDAAQMTPEVAEADYKGALGGQAQ